MISKGQLYTYVTHHDIFEHNSAVIKQFSKNRVGQVSFPFSRLCDFHKKNVVFDHGFYFSDQNLVTQSVAMPFVEAVHYLGIPDAFLAPQSSLHPHPYVLGIAMC